MNYVESNKFDHVEVENRMVVTRSWGDWKVGVRGEVSQGYKVLIR
jgi:hypothetical protein